MDYNKLLDLSVEIGYRLAMNGAETFRVEESISRILDSYGIKAEVFAIPNCLHVSIETHDGSPMTRMRRIGHHGNNLDAVEKYSNLSRRLCNEKPPLEAATQWVKDTEQQLRSYSFLFSLIGCFLIATGFAVLFGANLIDALFSGVCGFVGGLVIKFMERMKVNHFFNIIIAAFVMSFLSYLGAVIGLIGNTDTVIIGTLMILVPGLLFTNALRDIIYGDTNSGTNRIVQVFLIAAAMALGTGAALKFAGALWVLPEATAVIDHNIFIELLGAFIGSLGFAIYFNIFGPGSLLCAGGGVLVWIIYRSMQFASGDVVAYFFASMAAALFAECMARIRKYPAISYLAVSLISLIPGAGIYYTMNYISQGNMQMASEKGIHTIALTGTIAVGILIISSIFRLVSTIKQNKK